PSSRESVLLILVAGPYRSGTGDNPDKMAANVRVMEAYALPLFRAGHVPVLGEWFALPLVRLGGSEGADLMVRLARERGLNVFQRLNDVPGCGSSSEPT